jgi:protein SCO1/2
VGAGCAAEASSLPYYADRTFTPHWTVVDHSVSRHVLADTPFVDQTGRAFSPAETAGRIHVASFIFTTCASICPPLVSSLKKVQAATQGSDVILVSYSITPEIDTVDVLAAFGRDRGIDPERWRLLTGTSAGVQQVARSLYFADDDGLRASIVDAEAFLHTEKLLLVDDTGHIRGVYNGTQPFEVQKLIEDVATLRQSSVAVN